MNENLHEEQQLRAWDAPRAPSLDTRVALLERMADDLGTIVKDHEKRLRSNERMVIYGTAVFGLCALAISVWAKLSH